MKSSFAYTGLILAMLPATHAYAQEAPEEITVTARRQSESLSEVPASVTVLTETSLRQAGVVTTEQIVNLTPGVTIVSNAAQAGDAQINIRGINGARDAENSVALVVDGILKTNTASLNSYQGELTQVEVLKGPQGAYYGRNAAAGALVMTTRTPGEALQITGKASVATRDSQNVQGSISGPLTQGLGALVYGNFRHTDGFYENTGPDADTRGHNVDNYRGWNVGGRLFYDDGPLTLDLKGRYGEVRAGSLAYDVDFRLPGFASALGNPLFNEDPNDHDFTFNRNIVGKNWQSTKEASLRGVYDLGGASLSAWVAWSDIDEDFISDAAVGSLGRFNNQPACIASVAALYAQGVTLAPPQNLGPTPAASLFGPYGPTQCDGIQYTLRTQEDISAEVRLASTGDGALGWSVGAYYLNIDRRFGTAINEDDGTDPRRRLFIPAGSPNQTSQLLDDRFMTDVYAGFGSLDYKAGDAVTLSAALRYDREERQVSPLSPNLPDPVTGGPLNPGYAVGTITRQQRAYEQIQPKLAVHVKATDTINLFADWGIGFKAGGFNSQGSAAIIDQNINAPLGLSIGIDDDYRKERSSAFEAGFKARTPDGRFSIEGAVYHTIVTDMQFFEFYTGGFGVLRVVSNIDKVKLTGAELSANVRIMPGWSLYASGNYTDSEIKENSSRPYTEGNESPYTAKYTLNVGTQVNTPITDQVNGTLRIDYRLTGPTWFHTVQDDVTRGIFDLSFPGLGFGDFSGTRRDAYGLFDVRAGLTYRGWSATVFATNLFDKKFLGEIIPAPEFGGAFIAPGTKRVVGLELGFDF